MIGKGLESRGMIEHIVQMMMNNLKIYFQTQDNCNNIPIILNV